MNIEQLREYCISKKGTTEEFPFDNDTLVFKVMGKMFVMVPLDRWERGKELFIIKIDMEWSSELKEEYEGIIGGFQMGKSDDAKYVHGKYWNTVENDKDVSDEFQRELIDHSYNEVVKKFTKKLRQEFDEL